MIHLQAASLKMHLTLSHFTGLEDVTFLSLSLYKTSPLTV